MKSNFRRSIFCAIVWLSLSIIIAIPWINDASSEVFLPLTLLVITGIAFIPGFISAFLVFSLLFSKKTKKMDDDMKTDEEISILIACRNEEADIYNTIKSISNQKFSKAIKVYIIDNASTDDTYKEGLRAKKDFTNLVIKVLKQPIKGKHNALNLALEEVNTKYVITVDGDTRLDEYAIRNILYKIKTNGEKCAAVAGWILEQNSKCNFITRIQTYDYCISIGAVKKMQSQYNSTLVAQGAFSIYLSEVIKDIGGWPNTIGEDIVITWNILRKGYITNFCENAIAYTTVPDKFIILFRQRARWARGMIEALKNHKPHNFKMTETKLMTLFNLIMPFIDFSYIFFFIPAIILAIIGFPIFAGEMTLLLLPLNAIQIIIMYKALPVEIKTNKTITGFIGFITVYQIMMSLMSLRGYCEEIFNKKRVWK